MQEDNTHQGKSPKELKDARHKCKYLCYGMEGGNTVGMVRGKGHMKRTYERIEQWMNNKISFPSVPRCRLVDSLIIFRAHIEGYHVRRIYVDGGILQRILMGSKLSPQSDRPHRNYRRAGQGLDGGDGICDS
ncbi:hypothetical protein Tco_0392529 [Tanacetum coccineum]